MSIWGQFTSIFKRFYWLKMTNCINSDGFEFAKFLRLGWMLNRSWPDCMLSISETIFSLPPSFQRLAQGKNWNFKLFIHKYDSAPIRILTLKYFSIFPSLITPLTSWLKFRNKCPNFFKRSIWKNIFCIIFKFLSFVLFEERFFIFFVFNCQNLPVIQIKLLVVYLNASVQYFMFSASFLIFHFPI